MTLQKEMIQRDVSPNSGGNFGSVRELYRVTDDAGAAITIEQVVTPANWGGTYPFDRNTPNTTDSTYYVINTSLTQPAPTVVDIAVEYTNKVSFLNKSSTSPQQADRSQPGFCSINTRYYSKFVDLYHRATSGVPIQAVNPTVNDPYAATSRYGDDVGSGNVDLAGQPISFPAVCADVAISLTRKTNDSIEWTNIRSSIGKRLIWTSTSLYLGFPKGTLLVTGCTVNEVFAETSSVNYELQMTYSTIGHLRQIIGSADADGLAVLEANTDGNFHAESVFVVQPFDTFTVDPGYATTTGQLITSQEYTVLNSEMTE